ncbi:MAG: LptF/LptG family permease [Candidatus Sericytochromatia bacterium]|nr:LptF/LptG family permease [Candidatus Tanganyikabacteria bacterium]
MTRSPLAYWRPGRLDRYILAEHAGPFLFGVAAFTAILTASQVLFFLISLMVHIGLPAGVVTYVLLLRLPEMIFYTFPMSTLLATLLAFGRLSGDSEITAFRAAGVSLLRLVTPVLGFALVVSAATVAMGEFAVPRLKWEAKNLLYEAQHKRKLPLARDNIFFDELDEHGRLVRFFYARHFDGAKMDNVLVQEFDGDRLARIIQAEAASYDGTTWRFHKGTLYHLAQDTGEYRYVLRFDEQVVRLKPSLLALTSEHREPAEMTLRELGEHIRHLESSGRNDSQVNDLGVQWHQKLSIPFASLVFALVGASLGLRPQRASNALGLGLSILIIFAYYVAMFVSMALGQSGVLDPVWAAWMPNGVTGLAGGVLLWRASRR